MFYFASNLSCLFFPIADERWEVSWFPPFLLKAEGFLGLKSWESLNLIFCFEWMTVVGVRKPKLSKQAGHELRTPRREQEKELPMPGNQRQPYYCYVVWATQGPSPSPLPREKVALVTGQRPHKRCSPSLSYNINHAFLGQETTPPSSKTFKEDTLLCLERLKLSLWPHPCCLLVLLSKEQYIIVLPPPPLISLFKS